VYGFTAALREASLADFHHGLLGAKWLPDNVDLGSGPGLVARLSCKGRQVGRATWFQDTYSSASQSITAEGDL